MVKNDFKKGASPPRQSIPCGHFLGNYFLIFLNLFLLLVFLIPQRIQKIQFCRFYWDEQHSFTPVVIFE